MSSFVVLRNDDLNKDEMEKLEQDMLEARKEKVSFNYTCRCWVRGIG